MMFQEYALFPHMTIAENVGYGLRMQNMASNKAKPRIAEMLDLVGLSDAGKKYPHQLSGGQQQRVALARALAIDPEVLLLDEPLSNLDAKLRVRLREEIVRLQQELGKTMIFVTHDQEEALSISNQVAVMRSGKISQLGRPEEIYAKPASRYIAEFVGLANFLSVQVRDAGVVQLGDLRLPLETAGISGDATLLVRPEAFSIVPKGVANDGPMLSGNLVRRFFLGNAVRYWVDTPVGTMIVDDSIEELRAPGDHVNLSFKTQRLHLLPQE
jgi:ABC-type Fe3+/spermidine/putrescine transport system ATPase subunit